MKGRINEKEVKTNGERLTIVEVAYVMETISAILNTFSSNRTIASKRFFWRDSGLKWIYRFSYSLHLGSKSI